MKKQTFMNLRAGGRRRPRRRGTSRLFVLGALVASATVGANAATAADAAQSQQPIVTAAAPHSAQLYRFDIQPGALDVVVAEFRRLTGLTVVVTDPAIGMVQSPGVTGELTASQALAQLLMGTSVRATFRDATTVSLDLRGVTEFVEVTGNRPSVASPKYTEPLRDIPQTINLIPQEVIQQQGATTLRDVLRNVVGITFQAATRAIPSTSNRWRWQRAHRPLSPAADRPAAPSIK
jgi:catecholate siderophore receptor